MQVNHYHYLLIDDEKNSIDIFLKNETHITRCLIGHILDLLSYTSAVEYGSSKQSIITMSQNY